MKNPGMRAVPVVVNGQPVVKWSRQKLESEMRRGGLAVAGHGGVGASAGHDKSAAVCLRAGGPAGDVAPVCRNQSSTEAGGF